MSASLVSAILPIADFSRVNLARKTANAFISQQYTPFELIIVNGTGNDSVINNHNLDKDICQALGITIREVFVPEGLNAASMRNAGIKEAKGDWIFPIDDDDWFHPHRLVYQMANRREGCPCLLSCQLLVDISFLSELHLENSESARFTPSLRLKTVAAGIAATVLFPRTQADGSLWLYDESLTVGEHDELVARMRNAGCEPSVCKNFNNPITGPSNLPLLSVAFFHTANELTKQAFFGPKEPTPVLPNGLLQTDVDLLVQVLKHYNFSVDTQSDA